LQAGDEATSLRSFRVIRGSAFLRVFRDFVARLRAGRKNRPACSLILRPAAS